MYFSSLAPERMRSVHYKGSQQFGLELALAQMGVSTNTHLVKHIQLFDISSSWIRLLFALECLQHQHEESLGQIILLAFKYINNIQKKILSIQIYTHMAINSVKVASKN